MTAKENEIKELLEAFSEWWNNDNNDYSTRISYFDVMTFMASNNLALGKPEPLAKNKQFEQVCACIPSPPFINDDNLNIPYCRWCGEDFKQT